MPAHTGAPIDPPDPNQGYERRDVRVRVLVQLTIAVAVLVVASQYGLWRLAAGYLRPADRREAPGPVEVLAPAPRLQDSPLRDYAEFAAAQEQSMRTYGWVDREKGVVRIPIDRAIELALERGLPKPDPAKAPMTSPEGAAPPAENTPPPDAAPSNAASPEQSAPEDQP